MLRSGLGPYLSSKGAHMSHRTVFIKVSGDEYVNPAFLRWLKELSTGAWVVVCVGGGAQINEAFRQHGLPLNPHGPLGLETGVFHERQLQRDVLECNQDALREYLAMLGIPATVEIPVIMIGTVLCPVNGDQMVRTAYLGFDELYVVTTPEREAEKRERFSDLSKVRVLAFPPEV